MWGAGSLKSGGGGAARAWVLEPRRRGDTARWGSPGCWQSVFAAIVLLTIALTVALVFIGLYRMAEYNVMYRTVWTPRVRMSEIYPHLKTGDVILFAAATHSPANSMLTQTFHSHAGVLVREGELVHLSESQTGVEIMPGPDGTALFMDNGAVLSPLLTRLKYYTGVYYVMRLSRGLDAAREAAVKREAARLRRAHYPYPSLLQILRGMMGGRSASRHCFQHAARVLDAGGLTPTDRDAPLEDAGFVGVCREICSLPGRPLPGGLHYEPPVQIVYDLGGGLGPGHIEASSRSSSDN